MSSFIAVLAPPPWPGRIWDYLRLLHDKAGVGDREAVEQVHQDDDDEEDEHKQEREG